MNDEYTKNDIILTEEQYKKFGIKPGDKVFFGNSVMDVLAQPEYGEPHELADVDWDSPASFIIQERPQYTGRWSIIMAVKEPKKKVVPFDFSQKEVRDALRGKWIKSKEWESESLIDYFDGPKNTDTVWQCCGQSAEELLECFTFLDGTPCGVEVEDVGTDEE